MNSERWRLYPKGADFPRVAECPDCNGMGLRINKGWTPNYRTWGTATVWGTRPPNPDSDFYIECVRCVGAGYIIPPEWLTG